MHNGIWLSNVIVIATYHKAACSQKYKALSTLHTSPSFCILSKATLAFLKTAHLHFKFLIISIWLIKQYSKKERQKNEKMTSQLQNTCNLAKKKTISMVVHVYTIEVQEVRSTLKKCTCTTVVLWRTVPVGKYFDDEVFGGDEHLALVDAAAAPQLLDALLAALDARREAQRLRCDARLTRLLTAHNKHNHSVCTCRIHGWKPWDG